MAFREFNYEEFIEQIKQDYFSEGEQKGLKLGEQRGLKLGEQRGKAAGLIETCRELGISREDTAAKVMTKMGLSAEETEQYMETYWKE